MEDAERHRLEVLVELFCHLELHDQVHALAARAVEWSGTARALGFVREQEENERLVPAGSVPGHDDGKAQGIEVAAVETALAGRDDGTYAELPDWLEAVGESGEKRGPAWVLAVRSPSEEIVGLIVAFVAAPAEPVRGRVLRLLSDARPAIANGLAVRAIRALVIKDDTADCFNRRYFNEFLAEELSRASRFRASLSLIFFDMDNLKEVNSRLGHAMGSRTIYEVSQRVRSKIRRFDKLFRFGGDEFCIVLPETEWHGALEVAERVRESIAGRPLLAEETGTSGVKMTASFGIASYPLHARSREELIHLADWAMQRIKRGTKNSIAIAEIAKP